MPRFAFARLIRPTCLAALLCPCAVFFSVVLLAAEPATVVLLTDGRLFRGAVTEVDGGYRIESKGQFFVVPFTEVRLTAETVHQAYEKLRDGRKEPTVDDHLQLAEFCWKNNLPGEAHAEVVSALRLDPQRSEARALFQKIEAQLAPGNAATPAAVLAARSPFDAADAVTRSGLTRTTVEEYVTRVQPLLMNKCGNVSCHGQGSTQALKLVNTRPGAANHRAATDANLEMLQGQIDFRNPAVSPLLVRPADGAGPHKNVLAAAADKDRWKVVENVVGLIAKEKGPAAGPAPRQGLAATAPPMLQPAVANPASPVAPAVHLSPAAADALEKQSTQSLLEQIRLDMRPDAFDPEIFNRRVHGRAAKDSAPQRK